MKIYFTVTSDLSYDQRMIRICTTLAANGHEIVLVGRKRSTSIELSLQPFTQKRIDCFFDKGKIFYAEYNIRLFFYLLFKRMDCICAIDLDTILPCYFISRIKKIHRVYDAHELFCEMKEIVTRPLIYKTWKKIERFCVPKFKQGYTVNQPIADEFNKMYGVQYAVIRNVPVLTYTKPVDKGEKFLLYQGAVNEGRCFETLIPAMRAVNCKLVVCGDGNFIEQAKLLTVQNKLEDKIFFKGAVEPEELKPITQMAYIGINLVENNGLNNYLSLANKFFDYVHAAIPQLCVDYPAYAEINGKYCVATLTNDTNPENLALLLNNLLDNEVLYRELKSNCITAREYYNWQNEQKVLIQFYRKLENPAD